MNSPLFKVGDPVVPMYRHFYDRDMMPDGTIGKIVEFMDSGLLKVEFKFYYEPRIQHEPPRTGLQTVYGFFYPSNLLHAPVLDRLAAIKPDGSESAADLR